MCDRPPKLAGPPFAPAAFDGRDTASGSSWERPHESQWEDPRSATLGPMMQRLRQHHPHHLEIPPFAGIPSVENEEWAQHPLLSPDWHSQDSFGFGSGPGLTVPRTQAARDSSARSTSARQSQPQSTWADPSPLRDMLPVTGLHDMVPSQGVRDMVQALQAQSQREAWNATTRHFDTFDTFKTEGGALLHIELKGPSQGPASSTRSPIRAASSMRAGTSSVRGKSIGPPGEPHRPAGPDGEPGADMGAVSVQDRSSPPEVPSHTRRLHLSSAAAYLRDNSPKQKKQAKQAVPIPAWDPSAGPFWDHKAEQQLPLTITGSATDQEIEQQPLPRQASQSREYYIPSPHSPLGSPDTDLVSYHQVPNPRSLLGTSVSIPAMVRSENSAVEQHFLAPLAPEPLAPEMLQKLEQEMLARLQTEWEVRQQRLQSILARPQEGGRRKAPQQLYTELIEEFMKRRDEAREIIGR